jgi:cytochrome c peroxidase
MKPYTLASVIDIVCAAPVDRRRCSAAWWAVVIAGALAFTPAAIRPARSTENLTRLPPEVLDEIEHLRARISAIEAQTLARVAAPPDNQVEQVELLGKALLYDEQLSVDRNEACAFCHMPETGFTGPISQLNRTTAAYPGSVRTRFSDRKPQTHTYAPLSPVLHFNPYQGDMVGGNFWDMRATGRRIGNPAAEQAEGPPVNPVEMGLTDPACEVYRASQRPYRGLFEQVWGKQAFAITWPKDIETICNQPGPPPADDPFPVHLKATDRGTAFTTFDQIAQSLAGYEASAEVSPLSSKFDAFLGGKVQLTEQEKQGYDLFRGRAHCNECHRDGGPGEDPLFTDFTASNIGTPANLALPFYAESQPDARGYVANTSGSLFIDMGVGGFLTQGHPLSQPSARDPHWASHGPQNMGRFQVPTLRNVDKRPDPSFIKAYGHNGYFKSLKAIVHFYNTRDTLPRCRPNDPGEGTLCWPAPETTANMNRRFIGSLGLTDAEEDAIVAFLRTLSDGWQP